ncbi:hypothetical protein LINPERHAP1_LOCUS312, partial [Linum perenne]
FTTVNNKYPALRKFRKVIQKKELSEISFLRIGAFGNHLRRRISTSSMSLLLHSRDRGLVIGDGEMATEVDNEDDDGDSFFFVPHRHRLES